MRQPAPPLHVWRPTRVSRPCRSKCSTAVVETPSIPRLQPPEANIRPSPREPRRRFDRRLRFEAFHATPMPCERRTQPMVTKARAQFRKLSMACDAVTFPSMLTRSQAGGNGLGRRIRDLGSAGFDAALGLFPCILQLDSALSCERKGASPGVYRTRRRLAPFRSQTQDSPRKATFSAKVAPVQLVLQPNGYQARARFHAMCVRNASRPPRRTDMPRMAHCRSIKSSRARNPRGCPAAVAR